MLWAVADQHREATDELRAYALDLPGAWEDHPWDEWVAKVGKKVFVFGPNPGDDGVWRITVKLPESGEGVLTMVGAEPAGYGLGRSGWVSVSVPEGDDVPVDLAMDWIDESYRTVATKKLVAELDARLAEGEG